jgi:transposase
VAVACLFPWYWLADLWAAAGLPFVLGQALSMHAMHGGKATNDKSDSHKIAAVLRGGMLPQAYVYPAAMRATRDLLRRRPHLRRKRAELLAPVQHTHSQYHLPEIGKQMADNAHRAGVAERCEAGAVHKTIEVDLDLITYYDQRLNDLDLFILKTAKQHEAQPLDLFPTVPGIGKILRLVWLYAMHQIARLPRGQDFAASCRRVKSAPESGGKRVGTSGNTLGNAHLKWAFSEAATLFLRGHEPGQKYLARWEKKHDKGTALSLFAHKLARTVSGMLHRPTAFALEPCLCPSGSSAGELGAALDTEGMSLHPTAMQPRMAASSHAAVRLAPLSLSPALCLDTRSGSYRRGV